MPKKKNCQFFQTITIAQQNGFRPCLRCRPDLVSGSAFSSVDISSYLATSAKIRIEKDLLNEMSIKRLAERLGITSRHLRRIFTAEFGVSPIKFVQACRLSFSEQLLKNTELAITEVALKSGFNSLSRFNTLFVKSNQMTPTGFRRNAMRETIY